MSNIDEKWAALRAAGLDLGAARGPERDAGYGGRVREYEHGNVYWHPYVMRATGPREVHGGILTKYLALGGPGPSPAGPRYLGFPTSDEGHTPDAAHAMSTFEWGAIFWTGRGGSMVSGKLHDTWRVATAAGFDVGAPIVDQLLVAGGMAAYCEGGLVWHGPPSPGSPPVGLAARINAGQLGRPSMVPAGAAGRVRVGTLDLWSDAPGGMDYVNAKNRGLASGLWGSRLALRRVARPGTKRSQPVPIVVTAVTDHRDGGNAQYVSLSVPAGNPLADRTLYDLVLLRPDGGTDTLVPHALYAKRDWASFAFAHASDLHVSWRLDGFRAALLAAGRAESAAAYDNWNDRARDLVRYANHLHDRGLLDVLVMPGDLVDFVLDEGEAETSGGNFVLLENILLGRSPSPTTGAPPVEELRVPTFITLGNHDYRRYAYKLYFDVHVPILPDPTIRNYRPLNLTEADAKALQGGTKPTVSQDAGVRMAHVERRIPYFDRRFTRERSYVAVLGPHRLVMLDTGPDADPVDGLWEALKVWAGYGSENEQSFSGASPNSEGVLPAHLELTRRALSEAGTAGLVVVGMHAPPINPKGSEFAFFFRETQHPVVPEGEVEGFLFRRGLVHPISVQTPVIGDVDGRHRDWPRTGTAHFKTGDHGNGLDAGATSGQTAELLRLCAGGEGGRPVDLVLTGHGHNRVEYRLTWQGAPRELAYHMDFYLENPARYYASSHCTLPTIEGEWVNTIKESTYRVHPVVQPGAPARGRVAEVQTGDALWPTHREIAVPPYARPLAASADARAWWAAHRPLIVQTAAVGPRDANDRRDASVNRERPNEDFQGIRVFVVAEGVIRRAHYVLMRDIRAANGGALSWERAYAPAGPIVVGAPVGEVSR